MLDSEQALARVTVRQEVVRIVVMHLAEVAPLAGQRDRTRAQRRTQRMPPFRCRSSASPPKRPGAVNDPVKRRDRLEVALEQVAAAEAERQAAGRADDRTERHVVARRHVEAAELQCARVRRQVRERLDLAQRVAGDQVAEGLDVLREARLADRFDADAELRNGIGNVDVEIVHGRCEARQEARLKHRTHGPRLGRFLVQVTITAEERHRVDVVRVLDGSLADQGERSARGIELRNADRIERRIGEGRRSATRVGVAGEVHRVAEEQLADAGAANGLLVLAAEGDVRHRRQFTASCPGEHIADRVRVVRIARRAIQLEPVDEAVPEQRDTRFREEFADIVASARRKSRVETGDVARR